MAALPDSCRLTSVRLGGASLISWGLLGCGGGAAAPHEQSPLPAWVLPQGGAAVAEVPMGGAELRSVDAYGNLWLQGCEGLYVVSDDGIQRYRYQDTPSQHGSASLHPDALGRMWLAAPGHVSMVEAGQWRDVWEGDVYGIVVGADGTAWLRQSLDSEFHAVQDRETIRQLWPESGDFILTPGWGNAVFAGRGDSLWYATLGDELYHVDEGRFGTPYAMSPTNIRYYYDALDDTFGLSGAGRLTRVGAEAGAIREVGQWDISWSSALGRLRDGDLAVRDREGRILVMDGAASDAERVVALIDEEVAQGIPVSSPVGDLYFGTPSAVYRYREGSVEPVLQLAATPGVSPPEQLPFALALLEEPAAPDRAAFEPLVPFDAGAKVRITAGVWGSLLTASSFELDGEQINAAISVAPEFVDFAAEQGIALTRDLGVVQLWELSGYVRPGACHDSGDKAFHVVEAYPLSTPPEERAQLGQELRRRYAE